MFAAIALALFAFADDFDRLEGPILAGIPRSPVAKSWKSISESELGNLPNVLDGTRTAVLVVKTDEGNYARLLVSPALRKPRGDKGEPVPILVVERFDTFESGPITKRIARGRDLSLFDGFRLDLDSGQVVPDGQGGDLQFVSGKGGPALLATEPATLYTLTATPFSQTVKGPKRSTGRGIAPTDFEGTYRMFANGQMTGRLTIQVADEGTVTGRLRSDQTGSSYKITGEVGKDAPNRIRFSVELPRTRQEFDGLIFLEGKGAIAGSYTLLDRTLGFFAIRDGGEIAPDGEDVGVPVAEGERPPKCVIEITTMGLTIEGKTMDEASLPAEIRATLADDAAAGVLIRVADDVPSGRVMKVIDTAREAGAATVRIAAKRSK
jgi:hypothetical protein